MPFVEQEEHYEDPSTGDWHCFNSTISISRCLCRQRRASQILNLVPCQKRPSLEEKRKDRKRV